MLHPRLLALALSFFFVSAPVVVVPAAFAASATQDAYDDTGEVVEDADEPADDTGVSPADTEETAEASPSTAASTSLPFTGLEAGLIAAAGLGLAGTGLVLRRAARDQA